MDVTFQDLLIFFTYRTSHRHPGRRRRVNFIPRGVRIHPNTAAGKSHERGDRQRVQLRDVHLVPVERARPVQQDVRF